MTVLTVAPVTSDLPDVSSPRAKNISVFQKRKSLYGPPIPFPQRGALRGRHECWARDAMDAATSADECRCGVRQNRVVLISRRWDQALRDVSQGDGGNKARFTEESAI
jgi:hypothetical protein